MPPRVISKDGGVPKLGHSVSDSAHWSKLRVTQAPKRADRALADELGTAHQLFDEGVEVVSEEPKAFMKVRTRGASSRRAFLGLLDVDGLEKKTWEKEFRTLGKVGPNYLQA
jgi:hypothetical protein